MKRLMVLLLTILLTLTGCQQDALTYFQEATQKTDEINRAKSKLKIETTIELADQVKKDEKELADLVEKIVYTSDKSFDHITNENIVRQYLGTQMVGFDTVFYNNKGFEYLKIPFIGKYLKIEALLTVFSSEENTFDEPPISDATLEAIKEVWFELIEADDVVNLGNDVIDTPEGEVKVKKMVVTFSHEQVKQFLNQAINIVSSDEKFRTEILNFPTFIMENGEMSISTLPEMIDVDLMIEGLKTLVDDIVVEEFKMVTYVDLDQYIIESQYNIHLSFVGEIKKVLQDIQLNAAYQMYDLHEPITFEFPVVDESSFTSLEDVFNTLDVKLPFEN